MRCVFFLLFKPKIIHGIYQMSALVGCSTTTPLSYPSTTFLPPPPHMGFLTLLSVLNTFYLYTYINSILKNAIAK